METAKDKKVGPSCACGKTDLYEEWKKNNKQEETEAKKTVKRKKAKG